MQTRTLGSLGPVSALTLGGGGIGALWGVTTREEGIATLREAIDSGITVLDAAPGYNVCEELIGEAFDGRLPTGVLLTTKCGIGNPEPGTVLATFRASLERSLAAMRVDHVDAFFLHGHIGPPPGAPHTATVGRDIDTYTPWQIYVDEVIPAFETLVARRPDPALGSDGRRHARGDHRGGRRRSTPSCDPGGSEPTRLPRLTYRRLSNGTATRHHRGSRKRRRGRDGNPRRPSWRPHRGL